MAVVAAREGASVTQATAAALQSMIREGRYKVGEALPPQRELANTLGVSRNSLREAVSILATVGMLSIEQGRGTFVVDGTEVAPEDRKMSWRFAARYSPEEVYEFRLIAESHAAQLAAMTHTADDLDQLAANLNTFRDATRAANLTAYALADFDFHRLIIRFSRNRLLADMHAGFAAILIESQRLPLIKRNKLWEAVVEHERILEALTRSDPEGARYYMRQHLSRACARAGISLLDLA